MSQKGIAAVMAMWLLAILLIIGTTFVYMMRLEPRIAGYHRDEMKALYVAQAGIDHALYILKQDPTRDVDHLGEEWSAGLIYDGVDNDGDGETDEFREGLDDMPLEDEEDPPNMVGYFTVIINDEAGKVSLNNSLTDNSPWKNLLEGLIAESPESERGTLAQEIITHQNGTYGPFETLDELACVNTTTTIEINYSAYFPKAKVHHEGFPTNPATRLPINVNTANEEVLRAALGELSDSTSAILQVTNDDIDRVVQAILDYREGADGIERTADDNPFDGIDSNVGDQAGNLTSLTDGTVNYGTISTDLDPAGGTFASAREEFNNLINYIWAFGYPSGSDKITQPYVRDNIKDNFDPDIQYDNWDSNSPTTPDINDNDADYEILTADKTYTTTFCFGNEDSGNGQFFEIISTGKFRDIEKKLRVIVYRGDSTHESRIKYYKEILED